MNRNFLIAIVIGAACIVAYFILSSPSAADKPSGNTGAGGGTGTGAGTGTGTGGGNAANNPLSQLLSGVLTQQGPNVGVQAEEPIQIGRIFIPNWGWVKIFGLMSNVADHKYYIIESNGAKVTPETDNYKTINQAIRTQGKIIFGEKATV